jgi:hypothetical protein
MNTDGAKNRVRLACGTVHIEAAGDQPVDDMLDLGFGGPYLHHNDHKSVLGPLI